MSLQNAIRGIVAEMLAQRGVARHAMVVAVNPARGTVRVQYDEQGTTSGELPVAQLAAGNGMSVVCLPTPGTQVFVAPDMGDMAHGVVLGAVHFDAAPVGQVTPYKSTGAIPLVPGEPTIMGPGGASIRLTAGGVIESRGTWKHDGDLLASGQVTDLDAVHGSLDVLRQAYQVHKHGGVQAGGGLTGTTDHPTP